jgi:phosphatidylglycerophosphatase A
MLIKRCRRREKEKRRTILIALFFLLYSVQGFSQCAMCRASLESTGDTSQAEAVNDGIVYLMIMPYVLVGLIGFYVYRMYKKKKQSA